MACLLTKFANVSHLHTTKESLSFNQHWGMLIACDNRIFQVLLLAINRVNFKLVVDGLYHLSLTRP